MRVKASVVMQDVPLLLSHAALNKLGAVMDLPEHQSGHFEGLGHFRGALVKVDVEFCHGLSRDPWLEMVDEDQEVCIGPSLDLEPQLM